MNTSNIDESTSQISIEEQNLNKDRTLDRPKIVITESKKDIISKADTLQKKQEETEQAKKMSEFKAMLRAFKNSRKKDKTGSLNSVDNLPKNTKPPTFWQKLFFFQFNSIYKAGKQKEELDLSDLKPFPEKMKIENLHKKFTKFNNEKRSYSADSLATYILGPIIKVVKRDMTYACILWVVQSCLIYFVPYFTKLFLKEVKTNGLNISAVSYMIFVLFLSFILGLIDQHAQDHTNKTKAAASQILRGCFFQKLKNSDYRFMFDAEAGFISNMVNIEITKIVAFIGMIPTCISAPLSFFISYMFIYAEIGFRIWLPSTIFLCLLSLSSLIRVLIEIKINRYSTLNSKRADVFVELFPNIRLVKLYSLENMFIRILGRIRANEDKALGVIHFLYSVVTFLEMMMPVVCSLTSIVFYNLSTGTVLAVEDTFAIVSVLGVSLRPFKSLSKTFQKFAAYSTSKNAFTFYLDRVIEKNDTSIDFYEVVTKELKFTFETEGNEIMTYNQTLSTPRNNLEGYSILMENCKFYVDFTTPKQVIKTVLTKEFYEEEETQTSNNINKFGQRSLTFLDKAIGGNNDEYISEKEFKQFAEQNRNLKLVLDKFNLKIKLGEKVCLMGKKGSGKNTLMYSLLRETVLGGGSLKIYGTVSFVNMNWPSIVPGTMRDNILLGSKFEKRRYFEILDLVELDVSHFAGQDYVELSGDGMNLSPVELRKVLLARAVYNDADIFLFDNCFEIFGREEGRRLIKKIVFEELKKKTVVLMSHDVEITKWVSRSVVLEKGKIVQDGSYSELIKERSGLFYELVTSGALGEGKKVISLVIGNDEDEWNLNNQEYQENDSQWDFAKKPARKRVSVFFNNNGEPKKVLELINPKHDEPGMLFDLENSAPMKRRNQRMKTVVNEDADFLASKQKSEKKKSKILNKIDDPGKLLKAMFKNFQKYSKGSNTEGYNFEIKGTFWKAARKVFMTSGKLMTFLVTLLFVLKGIAILFADLWLGVWSNKLIDITDSIFFQIYLIISSSVALIILISSLTFKKIARNGLNKNYKTVVKSLIQNDLDFFSKIPLNRIVYRLTQDLLVLDLDLVSSVEEAISSLMLIFGGLIMVIYLTYGTFGFLMIFVVPYIWSALKLNMKCTLRMLHWSARFKSEMIAILLKVLSCQLVLRNFSKENFFDPMLHKVSNLFQQTASSLGNVSNRWLGTRMYFIKGLQFMFVYCYAMLVLKLWPEYFAQRMWILSLALVWTGKLSTQLTTFIHKILKSRNHMISYFRVTEYLDRHEDLSKKKMHKIDLSNRAVEIKNVSFWYNKEVMVLKNLSLEIKSRERVAIIGKPGSGKSTFVNLLMGLYSQKEKEHEDEMVKIYGQNMNEFDSMTWRKKVNYLSSNPKVFYGTLKKNIDPEDRYSTEEIIKVLHFLKLINYKDTQDLEELLQMDQECDGELLRNMSFDSFDISQMGDSMRIDELTDEEDSESERLSPPQLKSLSKVQERRMSKFNPKIKIREMKVNTPKYSRKSRKSKLGWSQVLKSVKAKKPIKGNSKIKGNLKKLNFDRRSSAMLQLRSPNKARISSIVVSPRSTKSPNKTFNFTQIQAALKKLTGPAKKASKNSFKKYTYDKKDELYIKQFLDMKAKNSEILTESMIKIAMMAKAFLEKSPMMILEDQAFHFEMLDDDYYYDVFWDYLKDSTIISILSDYNHLLRYDRVFVFKDGKVEESGKPIDLLKNKNSLLGEYVKEGNPELFENFKEMFNREEERREEIRGEKNNLWSNLQGKAMEIVEKSKKRRKSRRMRTIEQINALFVV